MLSWGVFGREGVWEAVVVRGTKRERRNSVPKDDTNYSCCFLLAIVFGFQ